MDPDTINAYDADAANFARRYNQANMAGLHPLLLRHLAAPGKILEIGCGSGREARFLAAQGFNVTAMDASAAMLDTLRRSPIGAKRVEFPCDEASYSPTIELLHTAFPLPNGHPLLQRRYDAVLALAVVMHIPDQELFEFAFQARQLLKPDGKLIISVSEGHAVNAQCRDEVHRLYRERPPSEIALLFERLGFRVVDRDSTTDSLDRPDIRWTTLVLRLDATPGERPVDQIEAIISRDKKDATYKLALLRALCDIAQSSPRHVRWHADGQVSVPLGLVAEKWLYYYWPLLDPAERFIPQKRGERSAATSRPVAFRKPLDALIKHFQSRRGGLDAFHAAYQSGNLDGDARTLLDAAINKIANTIVVGPVTYASQGDFSCNGRHTARGQCTTPSGLLKSLGDIYFRADVWRELCLLGHWISESIILRWAELTHEISQRQIPTHLVLARLLTQPATEREVQAVKQLFKDKSGLSCVWTSAPLAGRRFDIDHAIPFALWHNNELWNLLPADPKANNQKRDKLVSGMKKLISILNDRPYKCTEFGIKC